MSSSEHASHQTNVPHRSKPSKSELLSSAKVVAQSAQHALHHETDKIDKKKFAKAAGDLLDAASDYGKLEEKGYGKYVEKADGYLKKYDGGGESHQAPAKTEGGEKTGSGGGVGNYVKMAQGFLKK